jgi:small GTP-binding protein
MAYKEQFLKYVKGLKNEQMVRIAQICAIRALPFIGAIGNFDYWKERNRLAFLYKVLNAIDSAVALDTTAQLSANDAFKAACSANGAAIEAATAATYAASAVAATINKHGPNVTQIVTSATITAIGATVNTAYYYGSKYIHPTCKINLSKIILEDISYIKSDEDDKFNNDVGLYGDVWDNFQKALNDIGCGYWAKLYDNIFKNRFQIDKDVLFLRLSVPHEIKEQGAKAVADYLEQMELTGSEHLNEARIIILGEKGAGKTCLARRIVNPNAPMTEPNESTEGVDSTEIWKIDGKDASSTVNVHIWDFAGHVITHAVHRCFLSERCVYILVYDGRTENRNRLDYWLDSHIRNYGNSAPTWVLVNKFDDNKSDIPKNTLKNKYPFIVEFVEFSIEKDKKDLNVFCAKISEFIRNNPMWSNKKMPSTYYNVKETLEKLFSSEKRNYISIEEFNKEASKKSITNDGARKSLLEALHLLGICLWYKQITTFDMLVLNPNWISNGIYKTINWAHNHSKHTVSFGDFKNIFNDDKERYPEDTFGFIFRLMEEYELAYTKNDGRVTIPHILKEDQPAVLPDFAITDSLMIKYVSEQLLPPNTVCRLIVRHHEEIKDNNDVWRHGVVLSYREDTVALVLEDDRSIVITVKGNNKREYISKLKDTMDDIFEGYKSQKPESQYRIVETSEKISQRTQQQILLPLETITAYLEVGQLYFDPRSRIHIDLTPTAQIFNINIHNTNIYGDIYNGDVSVSGTNNGNIKFGSNHKIITNNFIFRDNNIQLQEQLNYLVDSLSNGGYKKEVKTIKSILSDVKRLETVNDKNKVKKSRLLKKLTNFLETANSENSSIGKVIRGVASGMEIIGNISTICSKIAMWLD